MEKIILVDCDDTIVDLLPAWVNALNNKYNLTVKTTDITEWNLCKFFNTLTHDQLISPLITPGFWKGLSPKQDAQYYIPQLQGEGYNIFIVTATDYRNFGEKTHELILKQFPTIDKHNIISCHNKQLIHGNILIDDNPTNLIGGTYQKILFTAQHNKNYEQVWPNTDIHRANNWADCYKLIHDLV